MTIGIRNIYFRGKYYVFISISNLRNFISKTRCWIYSIKFKTARTVSRVSWKKCNFFQIKRFYLNYL